MTEKRYSLRINTKDKGVKIFDNMDEDNWRILNLHFNNYEDTQFVRSKLIPVVDLLNEFSEENAQLKKKLQIYKSDGLETLNDLQRCYENTKKSMKRINVLEEENGQLKQEIDTIRAIKNDILTKALEQGVELL